MGDASFNTLAKKEETCGRDAYLEYLVQIWKEQDTHMEEHTHTETDRQTHTHT